MKSNAKSIIDKRLVKVLKKTLKDAPKVLGNEGQKAILENFAKESWEGKKWRLRIQQGHKENKKPILIGRTRKLIRAARRSYKGNFNGKLKWSIDGVPYAQVHNDGGIIHRKAHKRTATIKRKIGGNAGFVNGVWKKGRYKTVSFQGERHNVSSSSFKMPKRRYMEASPKFKKRLLDKLEQVFKANLK